MSFDIKLGVKIHGAEHLTVEIARPAYADPSYSIAPIVREAAGWDFKQGEWYCVKDVLPMIQRGIDVIVANPRVFIIYESVGCLGTALKASEALRSLLKCIYETAYERYSEEERIPLECLYVRW